MKRFFVEQDLKIGTSLTLSREESKHALRVMRLQVGHEISLTNGKGIEAKARLVSADGDACLEIFAISESPLKNRPQLELMQAILKGPKMDWLVEKVTELGVHYLNPVTTQFSVALEGKEDRWKRIVQAAMKQSGNVIAPQISPLQTLEEALKKQTDANTWKIIMSPNSSTSLLEILQNQIKCHAPTAETKIVLAVGPEGGFSASEEAIFARAGFMPAYLSKNILRGETAAIAALAILAHTIDFTYRDKI